jgi:hypothetical protein
MLRIYPVVLEVLRQLRPVALTEQLKRVVGTLVKLVAA